MSSSLTMTDDLITVLDALYRVEQQKLQRSEFDAWTTPEEVAAALPHGDPNHGNATWARERLEELWTARKVQQLPVEIAEAAEMRDVRLRGLDVHGDEDGRLRNEQNDARGPDPNGSDFAQVAIYSTETPVKFRSRVAELGRLLSNNYQRFQMAPATGVLRYERREQLRPTRELGIAALSAEWCTSIERGELRLPTEEGEMIFRLRNDTPRAELARATKAVMQALSEQLSDLAQFQATSVLATLAGLYSSEYQHRFDAHVVTAGVGSGKSFAFQVGALIHAACAGLRGEAGVRVLLLYPRVVLAANQFKDLGDLVKRVGQLLGIDIKPPVLDAGSQLTRQFGSGEIEKAGLYKAIRQTYGGSYPILVSNLDTLANRMQHPEATRGLVEQLDLIVCDEIHLLQGIYGSHARMLLKRLQLMRELWRLRARHSETPFARLLDRRREVPRPYLIGASATIAEPGRHTARLLGTDETRVLVVAVGPTVETGWVHHFFLRQKPEVSTMTALVNATACLIHNRRDGVFREYYQHPVQDGAIASLALDELPNPVQGRGNVTLLPRNPSHIHKTVGFCDSLDGVGRWADLVADNERTKRGGEVAPNPDWESYPYFTRFQEPLWRHVHQQSFATKPENWQRDLRQHYGELCRSCKKGIRCSALRVPSAFEGARAQRVRELWSIEVLEEGSSKKKTFPTRSYLRRLHVGAEYAEAEWLAPFRAAREAETISNLDGCPFFQTGLCWWWSMDHVGSNVEAPPDASHPLNGVKMPRPRNDGRHHFVNGIRLQSFTSQSGRDLMALETINDIFQGEARDVLRDRVFAQGEDENSLFVIGSPRLEVGVDLNRAMDGITYRAMRDPSSLQQKVGRVGREPKADTVLLHIVTQNTRDQYYFRNPQIALDPNYLQALPLHEDNRIVARHHFLMAIVDFLSLQGAEPAGHKIAEGGERLTLINDHQQTRSFSGWFRKVSAVFSFLFDDHDHQEENLNNLRAYLGALGAQHHELENSAAAQGLGPADAPMSRDLGVIDVFRHEFGPNFFLTKLPGNAELVSLAQLCSTPAEVQAAVRVSAIEPKFPRHAHFLRFLSANATGGNAWAERSYLRNLLTQPIFRRGVPGRNLPGDHPFVWAPNFFESVGTETVRIFESSAATREKGYESVSSALALLAPGTVTYRYDNAASGPCKVPVSQAHASGTPIYVAAGMQGVRLCVEQQEFFEPAEGCADIDGGDLPSNFFGTGPLKVFTPRQLAVIPARSEPLVTLDGLLADGDSRPVPQGERAALQLATPPRCYSLRWFRIEIQAAQPFPTRFQRELQKYTQDPVPLYPLPPVLEVFTAIRFDRKLAITDFVWGLDRQMMTRAIDPARLVYRGVAEDGATIPIAMGHRFVAPGLIFTFTIGPQSTLGKFLSELVSHSESIAFQSVLLQALSAFLSAYARLPLDPDALWLGRAQPSVFVIRNLKTILVFHLLRRWHPKPESGAHPTNRLRFSIDDVAGCFQPGHANYLDQQTFFEICNIVAKIHDAPSPEQHAQTLQKTWDHFVAACAQATQFVEAYVRGQALDILLNSFGIAMHEAALRQTGADRENLGYFYKQRDGEADVFLFDTDAFGNGTVELVRDNLVISAAERMLNSKLRQLGHTVDPLASKDFAHSLEEELQECASSQAAHLAYHGLETGPGAWSELAVECDGERRRAGALYDFIREELGVASFDETAPLRECPEFLAYISAEYPCYDGQSLVGRAEFPVFQALESASGYCLAGCVGCVVAPESNLHGSLNARETVNKTLLDAFYRRVVVESGSGAGRACYPASGPACTCAWGEQKRVTASGLARDAGSFVVNLLLHAVGGGDATLLPISPAVTRDGEALVFRTAWEPSGPPSQSVRVHMSF